MPRSLHLALLALLVPLTAVAEQVPTLEEVEVTGRQLNLVGQATSASQGLVGQQEIELRPILRTGDVLELVPGSAVGQPGPGGRHRLHGA